MVDAAGTRPILPASAASLLAFGMSRLNLERFAARTAAVEVSYRALFPGSTGCPTPHCSVGLWGGLTPTYVDTLKKGARVVSDEVEARRFLPWVEAYVRVILCSAKGAGDKYWAQLGGSVTSLDKGDSTWAKYSCVIGELLALEQSEGNKFLEDLPMDLPRAGDGGEVSEVGMGLGWGVGLGESVLAMSNPPAATARTLPGVHVVVHDRLLDPGVNFLGAEGGGEEAQALLKVQSVRMGHHRRRRRWTFDGVEERPAEYTDCHICSLFVRQVRLGE